ncbi:MAG: pyridoxal-phosphate dependent enzyme [Planctomycetes bacterium]|nr:pyridoxal-phosphate dependent enzyme [Planctomycetota bacterium]MCC7172982.1 pyridoxal-phosphate dependent enzyme [Planctomycetota bacterium]
MHSLPARRSEKVRTKDTPARSWPRAIEAAWHRIESKIERTAFERSTALTDACGAEVWLKHEERQTTGSFKLRGAMNALLALSAAERARGIVAASTGNHGLALAHALARTGSSGTIVVPTTIDAGKRRALEAAGATLESVGRDCVEAERAARALAARRKVPYLSPYNHPDVIAGQGTLGYELDLQAGSAPLDAVFVAVGGGGLAAGVAAWLKHERPGVRVIGCQPSRSAVMARSVVAGKLVEEPVRKTLSDATAGGIEAGSLTLPLCRDLIDEWILVPESALARAMRMLIELEHCLVEGAAALPLAALSSRADHFRGQRVALVLCGRNVDANTVRRVLGPITRRRSGSL